MTAPLSLNFFVRPKSGIGLGGRGGKVTTRDNMDTTNSQKHLLQFAPSQNGLRKCVSKL